MRHETVTGAGGQAVSGSPAGGKIYDGMALDPWRNGGRLFWSPTVADTRYNWRPQAVVHAEKRREAVARGEITVTP